MPNPQDEPHLDDGAAWQPVASGQAQLCLSTGAHGAASTLRMDYDFKGGGGFVVARRELRRAMPEDFRIEFDVRGRGPLNNLEIKLVDVTGHNVWRHVYPSLKLPPRFKRIRLEARDIEFAWGPASGSPLTELGSLEVAVVAVEGGAGTLSIADLQIVDAAPTEPPRVSASSEQPGFEARHALTAGWRPRPEDARPSLVIDWTDARALGGLIIDWQQHAPPRGFRIQSSRNGVRWRTAYRASAAGGHRSYVMLPDFKARYLRLEITGSGVGAVVRPQSFRFSRSLNGFLQAVAGAESRGWHPRWLQNEQSVWTPVGTAAGTPSALMNEDGMVEVAPGSYSVEPMLWSKGRLHTWNDVRLQQALAEGWAPAPATIWEGGDWRLTVEAAAIEPDERAEGGMRLRYRLQNLGDEPLAARLFLVIRPYQVTPPWQSFRAFGGAARIHELAFRDGAVHVDADQTLVPEQPPSGFGALAFDEGPIAAHLAAGRLPGGMRVSDPRGLATGALCFDIDLAPHASIEHAVAAGRETSIAARPTYRWRAGAVEFSGEGLGAEAFAAARASTAFVLLTRRGPALQPGPRRYTRSWIRDGAMMAAALLRMGHVAEVRDFIRWYAPYQREDGFVPCCVDQNGPDWLVEHDSHGQLIALIGDYQRISGDLSLAEESWDHIARAAAYIESIVEPSGLLPVSVSHEGYLAQPVHAFWDDFWAVKGLREAAHLAALLGRREEAARHAALAERMDISLFAAIESTRAERRLEFIPGSIEWADFDPTATANALYLFGVPKRMDRAAIERTFDRYLADWRSKRAGAGSWTNYTPYEIRIIGALVRLGRRDAALELLRFFLSDRRPVRWSQWPEIAWRDHRTPGHVGDLPHTWIAAEYVLAAQSLFAYEQDEGLVLGAGLAPEWLDGAGVRVAAMPTTRGTLHYTMKRTDADTLVATIGAGVPGPIVLKPPLDRPLVDVRVNGGSHREFDSQSVVVLQTPAEVACTMAP